MVGAPLCTVRTTQIRLIDERISDFAGLISKKVVVL
jgi:hypothetical protein